MSLTVGDLRSLIARPDLRDDADVLLVVMDEGYSSMREGYATQAKIDSPGRLALLAE